MSIAIPAGRRLQPIPSRRAHGLLPLGIFAGLVCCVASLPAALTGPQQAAAEASAAALARGKTSEAERLERSAGVSALPAVDTAQWHNLRGQKLAALGAAELAHHEFTAGLADLGDDASTEAGTVRDEIETAQDELKIQLLRLSAEALGKGNAKGADRLADLAISGNRLDPHTLEWLEARFSLLLHADLPAVAAKRIEDLTDGNGGQLAAQAWLALLQGNQPDATRLLAQAKAKRGELPPTSLEQATAVWLEADTATADAYDARFANDPDLDRMFMPEMRLACAQAYLARGRTVEAAAMLLNTQGKDPFAPGKRLLDRLPPRDVAIARLDPFNARFAVGLVAAEAAFNTGHLDEALKIATALPAPVSPFLLDERHTLLVARILTKQPDPAAHAKAAWFLIKNQPEAGSELAKLADENLAQLRKERPLWPAGEVPGEPLAQLPEGALGAALAPLFNTQPLVAGDPRFAPAEAAWTAAWGTGPARADLQTDAGRARWAALARTGALLAHLQHRVATLTNSEDQGSGKARGDRLAWSVVCDPVAPAAETTLNASLASEDWNPDVWPEAPNDEVIWLKSGFGDIYPPDHIHAPAPAVLADHRRMARMFVLYTLHPGVSAEGPGAMVYAWAQALAALWPPSLDLDGQPMARPGLASWPMIKFAWTVLRDPAATWDLMLGTGFRTDSGSILATYEGYRKEVLASDYCKAADKMEAWVQGGADPAKRPAIDPRWQTKPAILRGLLRAALRNSGHPLQVLAAYDEAVGNGAGTYSLSRTALLSDIINTAWDYAEQVAKSGAMNAQGEAYFRTYLDEIAPVEAALRAKDPQLGKLWNPYLEHRYRSHVYLAAQDLPALQAELEKWPDGDPEPYYRRYYRSEYEYAKRVADDQKERQAAEWQRSQERQRADSAMERLADSLKNLLGRGQYGPAQREIERARRDEPLLDSFYYEPLHNLWERLEHIIYQQQMQHLNEYFAIQNNIDAQNRADRENRRKADPRYRPSWDEQFAELVENARSQANGR